jgi:Fe-coproporphyrin III synthase
MNVRPSSVATAVLVRVGEITNRTLVLPLLVFYATSRCNSRCTSCDWWQHSGADDLTLDEIAGVAAVLPSLGTRIVAFSGGEPLLRSDIFDVAACFRAHDLTLQLLTSGVRLERMAEGVAEHFSRVWVSLDAARDDLYKSVRGIDALRAVDRGIARLRRIAPSVPVTLRSTLHRANFRELPQLIEHARTLGVDGISFLAADVSSQAFGRRVTPGSPLSPTLALTMDEVDEFAAIVERTLAVYRHDFESGFVAERPEKLRRLPKYYAALAGNASFPPVQCNAPWVSAVLEANGAVRPCFFHPPVGNVRDEPFHRLVTRRLPAFRADLNVRENPTCARCVCTLNAGWRNAPWS